VSQRAEKSSTTERRLGKEREGKGGNAGGLIADTPPFRDRWMWVARARDCDCPDSDLHSTDLHCFLRATDRNLNAITTIQFDPIPLGVCYWSSGPAPHPLFLPCNFAVAAVAESWGSSHLRFPKSLLIPCLGLAGANASGSCTTHRPCPCPRDYSDGSVSRVGGPLPATSHQTKQTFFFCLFEASGGREGDLNYLGKNISLGTTHASLSHATCFVMWTRRSS